MKHFIVGPVEMYENTKNILKNGYVYFRTDEYGNMVKKCLNKVSEYLGNKTPNSLIYLASSGTGAMEAVIDNCMSENDKALVINGGTFGHRFCELLKWYNIPFESIDLEWNEVLTEKHFEKYENKGYTTLFVNIDETQTGQLYDINILSNFCKRNNMYFVVDAISSFLADEYDMGEYGIDVTIISSQKGLCISAGMALISFSQRMIDKIYSNPLPKNKYFSFRDYLKEIERGQTPYTPPVTTMYELNAILENIENFGGKDIWVKNVENRCLYFRSKATELGFKIPKYPKSNTLTPLYFDDIDASEIVKILREKYEIYVNPCGGKLANKLLRVSHIGNITNDDIDDLLNKMVRIYQELKSKELVYDRK